MRCLPCYIDRSFIRENPLVGTLSLAKRLCKLIYTTKVKVKVAQLSLILCNSIEYTVHGILQARIMEWVAIPFSRGSSQPRDRTLVSCIASRFFTSSITREAQEYQSEQPIPSPGDLPNPGKSSSFLTMRCLPCYIDRLFISEIPLVGTLSLAKHLSKLIQATKEEVKSTS